MGKSDKIGGMAIIAFAIIALFYILVVPQSNPTTEVAIIGLLGTLIGAGLSIYKHRN